MKFEEFYWIKQNQGRLSDMDQKLFLALSLSLGDFGSAEIHIASYTAFLDIQVFEEGLSKDNLPYKYIMRSRGSFQK